MIWLILLLSAGMRLLHLANGRYFVISPDSYYFHAQAEKLAAGGSVAGQGSGIVFPIAWLGNVTFGSIVIPVALGVLSTGLLYLAVKKLYSKRIALCSAFCFAIALPAIFFQCAGYVDRDCLHLLLISACLFAVYYYNVRPLVSGLLIAGCMGLMWYEWGSPIIAVALVSLTGVPFLVGDAIWFTRSWKKAAIPLGLLLVGIAVMGTQAAHIALRVHARGGTVGELVPIDGREILTFTVLIPAAFVGLLGISKRKLKRPDLFILTWIAMSFIGGLFAVRLWQFCIPAVCILAGIGLAWIWKRRLIPKMALAALVLLMIGFGGYYAYNVDLGDPRTSATAEFQQAMEWLKDNSEQGDKVLSYWDWGYMIEDLSDRETVMDNGGHKIATEEMLDEGLESTTGSYLMVKAMNETAARFLVLYKDWPKNDDEMAFVNRAFAGDIGPQLEVAYRTENVLIIVLPNQTG